MSKVKTPKYKIGDKVKLNVGGPDMAVLSLGENIQTKEFNGLYSCQWFAGKKLDSGKFPEESLVAVTDEEDPESKK
ncbi:YodC family protein [Acinetobacter baumannii]|uniref:YodC family protein n=1 Tax=Acinetobacter baumannii TaxID=470 RepID=UPI003A86FDE5